MISLRRHAFVLLAALLFCPHFASAEEAGAKGEAKGAEHEESIDTEHIFGFVDGSDIGEKGEKEIDSNTIGSFGRIGSYNTADTETSFRYTITDNIRLSFGTLTDYYNIHDVAAYANISAATFNGLIGELRINLLNRQTAPFGMTISFNPLWRQFDPDSGARAQNFELPMTLLFDKELIPEKFFVGWSFAFSPSLLRVDNGWEHDDSITATLAGSYQVIQNVFVAAEIRHEDAAINGAIAAHALYIGPSVLYRPLPNLDMKLAWAFQVPDFGTRSLDLTTYERNQVLLHFAYSF